MVSGVVQVEWIIQVWYAKGILEETAAEVAVPDNGILAFPVIAEQDRIELAAVLVCEPIEVCKVHIGCLACRGACNRIKLAPAQSTSYSMDVISPW